MGATYGQDSLINSFGSLLGIEIKKIMRLFFFLVSVWSAYNKIVRYMGNHQCNTNTSILV